MVWPLQTTQDFVNLFVDSTGELLYFISIFVIYQAALLMALDQRRRSDKEMAAGRYVVSLAMAELAWLALMGGALYEVVVDDAANIMPPLEYAVNAIVLMSLSWGLLTAEYQRKPYFLSIFSVVAGVALVAGFVYTLQQWTPADDFNVQDYSAFWTLVTAALAGISCVLLLTHSRHVADIPLKLVFFGLIIAGNVYTLIRVLADDLTGDASGAVRWGIMTSSALVVVLVYRMVIDRMTSVVDEVASYAETISRPQRAVTTQNETTPIADLNATFVTPNLPNEMVEISQKVTNVTSGTSALGGRNEALELIKALGTMLDREEADALPKQTVAAVAEMLKADIVAVVSYNDAQWSDIIAAYDYANKQPITGMSINLTEQPTLLSAIQSKRQHQLTLEQNAGELQDLYTRLDINVTGPTYFQPLNRHGKVTGLLIVGCPFTRRELRIEELRLLESIGPIAARLLVISRTALINRVQAEENAVLQIVEASRESAPSGDEATAVLHEQLQDHLELAQQEINELSQYIHELQAELDRERNRVSSLLGGDEQAMSITQRIEAISSERETLQHERQQLARALKEAQATLAGATAGDSTDFYSSLIDGMKNEINDLRNQKEQLEQQLNEMRRQPGDAAAAEHVRDLLRTVHEDKAKAAQERDQIADQLKEAQRQLETLGMTGGVQGIAKQMAKLTEERNHFKTQAERAAIDREFLLKERMALERAIAQENERESKLMALEDEVARLVNDREALAKSRDGIKAERDAMAQEREAWRTDRARMLAHNDSLKFELEETLVALNKATEERQDLAAERNQFAAERDTLRAEATRIQNERDTLMARIDGDRQRVQTLGEEGVGAIKAMVDELTKERAMLEEKLLTAEQKAETLQRKLSRQTAELEAAVSQAKPPIEMDVIISLAQELRTPLSVIIGYTDTVLNESVGILGALQRKLLTRVKANVDRLSYLVEELVQVISLDRGDLKLQAQKVNLVDVIDDAITASRYKFSEKGIVLELDLSDDIIDAQADVEAMRQVVNHLIQNAYLVSPTDGTVLVTARREPTFKIPIEGGELRVLHDVVYVAIADQGGGISPEDQRRVFSRLYRADNPLIAGLGDTGVGMSITKALIEAHGGYIWLETKPDIGNTFKFVMPIDQPLPVQVDSQVVEALEE